MTTLLDQIRQELGPMSTKAKARKLLKIMLEGVREEDLTASRDHEHPASSALDREHLRLAMVAVRAALPVIYRLIDNEYNVETWGLLERCAELEAARDFSSAKQVAVKAPGMPSQLTEEEVG